MDDEYKESSNSQNKSDNIEKYEDNDTIPAETVSYLENSLNSIQNFIQSQQYQTINTFIDSLIQIYNTYNQQLIEILEEFGFFNQISVYLLEIPDNTLEIILQFYSIIVYNNKDNIKHVFSQNFNQNLGIIIKTSENIQILGLSTSLLSAAIQNSIEIIDTHFVDYMFLLFERIDYSRYDKDTYDKSIMKNRINFEPMEIINESTLEKPIEIAETNEEAEEDEYIPYINNQFITLDKLDIEQSNIANLLINMFNCFINLTTYPYLKKTQYWSSICSISVKFHDYFVYDVRLVVYKTLSSVSLKSPEQVYEILITKSKFVKYVIKYSCVGTNMDILNDIIIVLLQITKVSNNSYKKKLIKRNIIDCIQTSLVKEINIDACVELSSKLIGVSDEITKLFFDREIVQHIISIASSFISFKSKCLFTELFARIHKNTPYHILQQHFSNQNMLEDMANTVNALPVAVARRVLYNFCKLLTGLHDIPSNPFAVVAANVFVEFDESDFGNLMDDEKFELQFDRFYGILHPN